VNKTYLFNKQVIILCGHSYISLILFGLQVTFVKGIATTKGGTHIDYVANQVAAHLMEGVTKNKKDANMKLHTVKGYLWVFVNALIENPAFDSQTKETLTTRTGSFGSKCDLPLDYLKKSM
jgi:DNA topoisomerase-2